MSLTYHNLLLPGLLVTLMIVGVLIGTSSAKEGSRQLVIDFTSKHAGELWRVLNDNVMGGRSKGGFEMGESTLYFSGRTNTNGGGFSSIRTVPIELDLSGSENIKLRVKGDGRRYIFTMQTTARATWFFRVNYWHTFETKADEWTEVTLPLEDFYPTHHGRRLRGPRLDTSDIRGLGLMIYDKQDGPFALEVDWITSE